VFFGSNSLPALWDAGVLSASLTVYGPASEARLGLVAIGDVNGDGQPDLLARSPSALYILYSPLPTGVLDLASTPASVSVVTGLSDGWLAAGDVDGDGKSDAIVSGDNEVVVLRGGTLASFQTLAQAAWARITDVNAFALHTADWNGDGKAEVIIGDALQGQVFVIFGSSNLQGTAQALQRAGWIITGETLNDQFGFSLGSGDLDADGTPDLILGSRAHSLSTRPDADFNDAGAVYVLYGGPQVMPALRLYLPVIFRN
jgi:hypothetical protein